MAAKRPGKKPRGDSRTKTAASVRAPETAPEFAPVVPASLSWNFARLAQRLAALAQDDITGGAAPSKLPAGLYLVATPIGHRGDITLRALVTLMLADAVLAEDTAVTGALLHAYGLSRPMISYHDHNEAARLPEIMKKLAYGGSLALVSDAGMPLVSDPGFRLARAALQAGLPVTVCPGASAVTAGLALSALPPEPFLFAGFPPSKSKARRDELKRWSAVPATLIFYESPSRLAATLADMAEIFGARQAAICRELTKLHEESRRDALPVLAAHYASNPARGEITIVVAPPLPEEQTADLDGLLAEALERKSLRDAVAEVADATGIPRGKVYERALELRGKT
ncbi:MAG: 16S rRNA (cytidine(1402)-2'-O)-methyltransferase [Alphaproteobacteria bacterium]